MAKNRTLWLGIVVLVAVLAGSAGTTAPTSAPGDQQTLAESNNRFACSLYARLKDDKGNLFFSPYSISTALAMTYAGARGETAVQMAKTLEFTLEPDRLHPAVHSLIEALNAGGKKGDYELSVANALWGQKGHGFLPDFLDLTQRNYRAGLRDVDFSNAQGTRRTINAWVEKETRQRIKDLIKEGVITPNTALILTNAIYFKGSWSLPFNNKHTQRQPFTLLDNTKVDTLIMHRMGTFNYMKGDDLQVLELPYVGRRLSMIILLPNQVAGLPAMEKLLTGENLRQWLANLHEQNVSVALPKFSITSEFRLNDVLKSMGMADAFSGRANFSGMDGQRGLFISHVLHKAFVDVNEQGTEAAAATGVIMKSSAPPVFRADHPFIFLIRDIPSNTVLFIGRLMNPKE
ncbi:MAG TPA: serpin family protein [Phycisphaerae bacterium]|nr:serpin family protein [Phycisphaerae bacterium]HRY70663.1 serpin family protein [Phycisphaerae bacterium]HSA28742.1 serpin family protein [Phycisphaerae bacterium]